METEGICLANPRGLCKSWSHSVTENTSWACPDQGANPRGWPEPSSLLRPMARHHSPLWCVTLTVRGAHSTPMSVTVMTEASADYIWVSKYSPELCTAHVRDTTLWIILLWKLYNIICHLNMPYKMTHDSHLTLGEIFIGNSGRFYVH